MTRIITLSMLAALALGGSACTSKDVSCDDLAASLCEAKADHCIEARRWIEAQAGGEADARAEACARVLADPQALASYRERFARAMSPAPVKTAPPQRPMAARTRCQWGACRRASSASRRARGSPRVRSEKTRGLSGERLGSTISRVVVAATSGAPSARASRRATTSAPGSQPRCEVSSRRRPAKSAARSGGTR